mmetsp:Transcript_22963/g.36916  ORF Transcript_22963/g.36916 Transcript_22963/m.36916 type:complete len:260 (-) Transcript_22963:2724-3503(-)
MHRVVHGQTDSGDQENALILPQTPADDGHKAQEGDGDAADARDTQSGIQPVPGAQEQHDVGHKERQADTRGGGLHHVTLGDHEQIELCRLVSSQTWAPAYSEFLPAVIPSVRLVHCVLRGIRSIVAMPRKLDLRHVGGEPDTCHRLRKVGFVLATGDLQARLPLLEVRRPASRFEHVQEICCWKTRVAVGAGGGIADLQAVGKGAAGSRRTRQLVLCFAITLRPGPVICHVLHPAVPAACAEDVCRHSDTSRSPSSNIY